MAQFRLIPFVVVSSLALAACDLNEDGEVEMRAKPGKTSSDDAGRNLHLEPVVRFLPAPDNADIANGRAMFGVDAVDDNVEDKTLALFEGFSASANKEIVSNDRTCFTCHRGAEAEFGIDLPIGGRLSDTIELSDALFTGIEADAQGDPDAFENLDQHALFKYKFNRFDPRPNTDGFDDVFGWHKSPGLLNVAFMHGLLTDGRVPTVAGADRGAISSHTQEGDLAIDDLLSADQANDMLAFQFTLFTDERLAALRDPTDPLYDELVSDPYYTVDITTNAQKAGRKVFDDYCFSCHNTPQVFSGLDNVEARGNGDRPVDKVAWAPSLTKTYNVGVSERNKHGLRFTKHLGDNEFEPITLLLAKEDGSIVEHEVTFDVGLAASTARHDDVGRFKVPGLRNLANNAPYFHDNSCDTIEEVVDYFNSDDYNESADGQNYPIYLNAKQRENLIEFLYAL
jgi:mono/diheme cytochrome c family protein